MLTRSCSALPRTGNCATPLWWKRRFAACSKIPRLKRLVDNFAGQWLEIRNMDIVKPDADSSWISTICCVCP